MIVKWLMVFTLVAIQWREYSCRGRAHRSIFHTMKNLTDPGVFTTFLEGPVVDKAGNLYVVNMGSRGTIGKVPQGGTPEIFTTLPEGSAGNGLRTDAQGNIFVADVLGKQVLKIDPSTLEVKVFAQDPRMSAPNDLAITSQGVMFLSDPVWEERKGNLWRIDTNGVVSLLDKDLGAPNGIEVSPQEDTLYVGEYFNNRILAYDLSPTGEIGEKRVLVTFPSDAGQTGPDGIRCDARGRLFAALYGAGAVAIVSPGGIELTRFQVSGVKPTNVAFGGYDGRTLYVTVSDLGLIQYTRAAWPGRAYCMWDDSEPKQGCGEVRSALKREEPYVYTP